MTATSVDSINPSLLKNVMTVDPELGFTPVAFIASTPNVLVVHPSVPARNLKDLIDYLKKDTTSNFGSFGAGTTTRVGWAQFEQAAGLKVQLIPHKGDAQMLISLISNIVQVSMPTVTSAAPFVHDGKLRAIAVTSLERSPALPDVPTIAESGFPGYEATTWFGILAPKGTPEAVVQLLNTEINKAMATSEMQEKLLAYGASNKAMSVTAFRDFLARERRRWAEVVNSSGITPD